MATKKKATKKASNPPMKVLICLDESNAQTEDSTESLLGEICGGNYYFADTIDELITIVEENDEECVEEVYEVTFKKIGTITKKSRVFNEYV